MRRITTLVQKNQLVKVNTCSSFRRTFRPPLSPLSSPFASKSFQFCKPIELSPLQKNYRWNIYGVSSPHSIIRFCSVDDNQSVKEKKKEKRMEVKQEGKGLLQHARHEIEVQHEGKGLLQHFRAEREAYLNESKRTSGFSNKAKLYFAFLKKLWHVVREESKEVFWKFWFGFKDLYYNSKEAQRLKKRKREGEVLSRQQERFIRQNRQDLKSLIPFFLIWRVPIFGDFLLPIFIARFPGLLPSTFKLVKKPSVEDRVKALKLKQLSLLEVTAPQVVPPELWERLCAALPMGTQPLSSQEIEKHQSLLHSLLSCPLARSHWASVCSVIGLGTRAPRYFLKRRLEEHVTFLIGDDKLIRQESVESLSEGELVDASQERGLRVLGLSQRAQRDQLQEWLRVPRDSQTILGLLVYSHAFLPRDLFLQPS